MSWHPELEGGSIEDNYPRDEEEPVYIKITYVATTGDYTDADGSKVHSDPLTVEFQNQWTLFEWLSGRLAAGQDVSITQKVKQVEDA